MNIFAIFALLVSTTVVSSAVLDSISTTNAPVTDVIQDGGSPVVVVDTGIVIDGIPIDNLNQAELDLLLQDKDNQLIADLDIASLKAKTETGVTGPQGLRKKRVAPLVGIAARVAFSAARSLFRGSARGALSRSGSRVTQQYTRSGGFNNAMRDFNRFGAQNQKSISGKFQGRTGTVGNHRVTVRNGSSGGSPTLEIRSPRPGGSTYVRKFRYNQN